MDRLLEVAGQQRGLVTTADARGCGVNPVELRKLTDRGRLERVGYGLYRIAAFPHRAGDDLMAAVLWTRRAGVIGGATALALHDLADVNPRRIDLTVPGGWRTRQRGGDQYRLRHADLPPEVIDEVADIPVVVPAQAIIEAVDDGVDPRLIDQAMGGAHRRGLLTDDEARALERRLDRSRPGAAPAQAPTMSALR